VASKWTLKGDSRGAENALKRTGKAMDGVGKSTRVAQSGFLKLSAGVTAANQAFQLGAAAVRAAGRAYDLTIGKVIDLSKEFAEIADDIAKTSKALNINAQELQGWRSLANLAGAETKTFDKAILNIGKTALDAKRGLSTAVELFEMAGVEALDAGGSVRAADEILKDFSANLASGMIPETEKAALSAQLLRDRTGRLINVLNQGPEAIEANIDRMREWNTLIGDEALRNAEDYVDSQQLLNEAVQGWTNTVAEAAIPQLNIFNRRLATTIGTADGARDSLAALLERTQPLGFALEVLTRGAAGLGAGFLAMANEVRGALLLLESGQLLATKATIGFITTLQSLPGGDVITGALGLDDAKLHLTKSYAEQFQLWQLHMKNFVDQTALANSFVNILLGGLDELEDFQGVGGGGGGGGGGPDAPTAGEAGVNEEIVINKATVIDLGDTTEKVTDDMEAQWMGVASAIGSAAQQMVGLARSGKSAASVVTSILGLGLQAVGGAVGGVAGAAVSAAGGIVTTLGGAMADRGLMPTVIADRGASLANIPGGGSHSVVIKRNDEMVLDPAGTSVITRMLKSIEANSFGGVGDGANARAGMMGGGGAVRVTVPVILDGREIALVVDQQFADMRSAGEGQFAGAAA